MSTQLLSCRVLLLKAKPGPARCSWVKFRDLASCSDCPSMGSEMNEAVHAGKGKLLTHSRTDFSHRQKRLALTLDGFSAKFSSMNYSILRIGS